MKAINLRAVAKPKEYAKYSNAYTIKYYILHKIFVLQQPPNLQFPALDETFIIRKIPKRQHSGKPPKIRLKPNL